MHIWTVNFNGLLIGRHMNTLAILKAIIIVEIPNCLGAILHGVKVANVFSTKVVPWQGIQQFGKVFRHPFLLLNTQLHDLT